LITNLGVKLILATFNKDKWEALHVIVVSTLPKNASQLFYFYSKHYTKKKTLTNCPTLIIGDFNIHMLTNTS
jgi:hypothetical protein